MKGLLSVALFLITSGGPSSTEVWSTPPVSTDQFESHPAFDPRTGDLWFVRSSPQFRGWRLKVSHCTNQGWSPAVDAPIAGDGVEADPWFSPDGRTVWLISTRSSDRVKGRGLDIWRSKRDGSGRWSQPERLPAPINSAGNEWFPRMDRDRWLYFGSDRPGGYGKTDIWRARETRAGWTVENAGPSINSVGDEYEALPNPNGKWLLLSADAYYRSDRTTAGWAKRVRLGPENQRERDGDRRGILARRTLVVIRAVARRWPLGRVAFWSEAGEAGPTLVRAARARRIISRL